MDVFESEKNDETKRQKFHETITGYLKSKIQKNSVLALQILNTLLINFGPAPLENLKPYL